MTSRIITGTYVSGYGMVSPVTDLTVAASGYVEGNGVTSPAAGRGAYTIVNDGRIKAGPFGVYLYSGGSLTNGATTITTAQISGGIGVLVGFGVGDVVNFGTIQGVGVSDGGAEGNGVVLSQGGKVTNGTAADRFATIAGAAAISVYGQAGTINNFGLLYETTAPPDGRAIYLAAGGVITNGSASDVKALIGNRNLRFVDPIVAKHVAATVSNFASIVGESNDTYDAVKKDLNLYLATAIDLTAGGRVSNGAQGYIDGTYGVAIAGAPGTVVNNGQIIGYFEKYVTIGQALHFYDRGFGVSLAAGGLVDNGTTNSYALIFGEIYGVKVTGAAGTVHNLGAIKVISTITSTGVDLADGGSVVNGGASDHTALIKGFRVGVTLGGAGVVTNYGTLGGYLSVEFSSSADRLVVEAGSAMLGYARGGAGTLELACGAASIGQDASGGWIADGALSTQVFVDFGTLDIAAGTDITLDGTGVTDTKAGDIAELDIAGELTVTGSLATGGRIIGAGTLSLQGGQTTFGAGTDLLVGNVTELGAATGAIVATALTSSGVWGQAGGTVSVNAGKRLTLKGSGSNFSGTLAGPGTVEFAGGADTLAGATLTAAHQIISGSTVTLSGAVTRGAILDATTANLIVAAGGATLTGGGELFLTDKSTNSIHGAGATATLTNAGDRIVGAGQLGGGNMILINELGGIIDGDYAAGLTINTGAQVIVNGGEIESAKSGAVSILSAVANSGTLYAVGKLTVTGAVSGAGVVRIAGGVADFTSTFNQNVAFTTAGGVLELGHSLAYTGQISGFAKTPISSLDLADIGFGLNTTATFSGTAKSGLLTVTDGTHTANIALVGDYLGSVFAVASDGHKGTSVTDSPAAAPLVAAMAGFGAQTAGGLGAPAAQPNLSQGLLASAS